MPILPNAHCCIAYCRRPNSRGQSIHILFSTLLEFHLIWNWHFSSTQMLKNIFVLLVGVKRYISLNIPDKWIFTFYFERRTWRATYLRILYLSIFVENICTQLVRRKIWITIIFCNNFGHIYQLDGWILTYICVWNECCVYRNLKNGIGNGITLNCTRGNFFNYFW